jgi:hypothetical protein
MKCIYNLDYLNKLNQIKLEQLDFERKLVDQKLDTIEKLINEYDSNTKENYLKILNKFINQILYFYLIINFDKEILKLVKFYETNNIIVQGEAIGKFNGNHHNLKQDEIRLFNIYVDGRRINQSEFIAICLELNIPHCLLFDTITLNHTMNEILEISKIKDILNPKVPVEGLIWRCVEDNTSFKVINNEYLLKEK